MVRGAWLVVLLFLIFPSFGSEELGKPWIYHHIVEPFLGVDSFLDQVKGLQIDHCKIYDKGSFLKEQYDGLGSCVYQETPFFDLGENSRDRKYILISASFLDRPFELKMTWTSVTVGEILFGLEESQIEFLFETRGISLNEFVYILLLDLTDSSEHSIQNTLLSNFFETTKEATQLKLQITPVGNGISKIQFTLLDSIGLLVYDNSVYTNYQDGQDEFFMISEDLYSSRELLEGAEK